MKHLVRSAVVTASAIVLAGCAPAVIAPVHHAAVRTAVTFPFAGNPTPACGEPGHVIPAGFGSCFWPQTGPYASPTP